MKIAVDTDILVQYVTRTSGAHRSTLARLEQLTEEGHQLVVPAQCLCEYWAVATRPIEANGLGSDIQRAQSTLQLLLGAFTLLPDPPGMFDRWLYLCIRYEVRGKSAHDARIAAWMLEHEITTLYTYNTVDFARFQEIDLVGTSDESD